MNVTFWTAVAIASLVGSLHCAGMCGGIVTALGFSVEKSTTGEKVARWPILLSYNIDRITSYGMAGMAVGWLGQLGSQYLALGPVLRSIAGVLLILMGCYLADWWKILTHLEWLGAKLWRKLQPVANGLFQVRSTGKGFAFGLLWGWLPCGLVYSALAYAAASADPVSGFFVMVAFGIGTLPAMLLGGLFSQQLRSLLQRRSLRWPMALILVLFGLWTLWSVYFVDHSGHTNHGWQNSGSAEHLHMMHSHE